MKSLACTGMLLSSLMLTGCFYLIEPGKGGVAERFGPAPITPAEQEIIHRLQHCQKAVLQLRRSVGVPPSQVWLQQLEQHLVLSQRYLSAGLPAQAAAALDTAEQMLASPAAGNNVAVTSKTTNGSRQYDSAENHLRPAAGSGGVAATARQ